MGSGAAPALGVNNASAGGETVSLAPSWGNPGSDPLADRPRKRPSSACASIAELFRCVSARTSVFITTSTSAIGSSNANPSIETALRALASSH